MDHVRGFLDWATGVHRPRKKVSQPLYIWQRPDLIDPPLRPLPPSRPRRLTDSQNIHSQQQSALIARLPVEIRVLIWEYVVGPENDRDVLHIELADGTLRHNRCYQRETEVPAFQHDCWRAAWRKTFRVGGAKGRNEPADSRRAILPLLYTCKLMYVSIVKSSLQGLMICSYSESVDLLCSSNIFDFRRTDSLIRLPYIMLPHRMQQLRRVRFSTAFACYDKALMPPGLPADFWKLPDDRRQWAAACEVLASLRHLQYVRATIIMMCQRERHRHNEAFVRDVVQAKLWPEILQPLKAVHASEFTVEVTEPLDTVRERLGPTPFRLVERDLPVSVTYDDRISHLCRR